jgi:hypothetical protein
MESPLGRFTPTHVGKTAACLHNRTPLLGSPPRTWGRPSPSKCNEPYRRFTPTHVGKTSVLSFPCSFTTVHPHARGEDHVFGLLRTAYFGSPPRTWGRPPNVVQRRLIGRFTPTHVGKTQHQPRAYLPRPVHPHARGEDNTSVSAWLSVSGSPPRTWGRQGPMTIARQTRRFTPTHVGKTLCPIAYDPVGTVHPHARGEDPGILWTFRVRLFRLFTTFNLFERQPHQRHPFKILQLTFRGAILTVQEPLRCRRTPNLRRETER